MKVIQDGHQADPAGAKPSTTYHIIRLVFGHVAGQVAGNHDQNDSEDSEATHDGEKRGVKLFILTQGNLLIELR